MTIKNVLKYETNKLLHDKTRLFVALLLFFCIVGLSLFVCYFWMDESFLREGRGVWNNELESRYILLREEAYDDYLISSHLKEPDGPFAYGTDPSVYLQKYYLYSYMIDNKLSSFVDGYSVMKLFANPQIRLLMFQNLVYMSFPILIAANIYFTFVYDKSVGYSKNYSTLFLDKKKLRKGKLLFSVLILALAFLSMNLIGLVFSKDVVVLAYSRGQYHASSLIGVYFERMMEMTLGLSCFYIFFFLLSEIKKHYSIYVVFAIIVSLALFPSIWLIKPCMQGTAVPNSDLGFIPLINLMTINSIYDQMLFYRVGVPLAFLLLGLTASILASRGHHLAIKKARKGHRQ